MEKDQKTTFCPKCQKQINSNNFIIHEAMCKGSRESWIMGGLTKIKSKESKTEFEKGHEIEEYPNLEEEHPGQKQPETEKKEKTEYPKLYEPERTFKTSQEKPKPQKEHKPQVPKETVPRSPPQPEEKFRCTDCGYMMSMKELDSHPNDCPAQQKKCQYCGLQFPHYLMEMHLEVCEKLPNRREPRRPSTQRQDIRQELNRRREEDEVARSRVRPPRGTREGNIPANIVPVQTQTFVRREGNDRVTIKRVKDRNGRVYEQRYREPLVQEEESDSQDNGYTIIVPISMNQRGMGQGGMAFINMEDMFSGGGGFQQMIRRLMANMNINRQQNPGLTKQQIEKIPIIKYNPDGNQKSTSCTICVTDLQRGVQVMKLPCGHLFNPQCLVPWLKNSAVCPNCRGRVKPN